MISDVSSVRAACEYMPSDNVIIREHFHAGVFFKPCLDLFLMLAREWSKHYALFAKDYDDLQHSR